MHAVRTWRLTIVLLVGTLVFACTPESSADRPADSSAATSPVPAFPGAEGFGTMTRGGRGGRVIAVTTLDDSGRGSLREAMEARGPRIVVFRTGGTIVLKGEIDVRHPFLTVAGQSAPGGGISLRADPGNTEGLVDLHTHDVVIRYVRFRQGPHDEIDAAIPLAVEESSFVVVDHCSFSWGTDENLTSYDDTHDVTFSWNILAEGLSNSTHYEGEHSRGLFMSGERSRNLSAHHNLMAHNMRRNPEVNSAGTSDIRNNVVYNWGTHASLFSDKNGKHTTNVIGNFFKPGPSTDGDPQRYEIGVYPRGEGMALFVRGNIGPRRPDDTLPERAGVDPAGHAWLVEVPAAVPPVTTTSARQAFRDVLASAGARSRMLDAVDQRVISDVRNGTGSIIDDPAEVGGWPVLDPGTAPPDADSDGMPDGWETPRGLDSAKADGGEDRDGDGYSNVEEYLNGLVTAP